MYDVGPCLGAALQSNTLLVGSYATATRTEFLKATYEITQPAPEVKVSGTVRHCCQTRPQKEGVPLKPDRPLISGTKRAERHLGHAGRFQGYGHGSDLRSWPVLSEVDGEDNCIFACGQERAGRVWFKGQLKEKGERPRFLESRVRGLPVHPLISREGCNSDVSARGMSTSHPCKIPGRR